LPRDALTKLSKGESVFPTEPNGRDASTPDATDQSKSQPCVRNMGHLGNNVTRRAVLGWQSRGGDASATGRRRKLVNGEKMADVIDVLCWRVFARGIIMCYRKEKT